MAKLRTIGGTDNVGLVVDGGGDDPDIVTQDELDAALSDYVKTSDDRVYDELFDYTGSNTFTLQLTPAKILEVWVDTEDDLVLVRINNVTVVGNIVAINNQTFASGDVIRIQYAI